MDSALKAVVSNKIPLIIYNAGGKGEAYDDFNFPSVAWTLSAHEALLRVPGVAAAVVEGIGDQLRERQESLAQLSIIRHVERVRYKLTQLARTHGKVIGGGVRIALPLTQRLLAEMIGSARAGEKLDGAYQHLLGNSAAG